VYVVKVATPDCPKLLNYLESHGSMCLPLQRRRLSRGVVGLGRILVVSLPLQVARDWCVCTLSFAMNPFICVKKIKKEAPIQILQSCRSLDLRKVSRHFLMFHLLSKSVYTGESQHRLFVTESDAVVMAFSTAVSTAS